jgi:hypothetical protein
VDDPAVTSALYWLSWMPLVRNVAAALVVIGVGAEFLEGWISEPWRETVEHARELQMAQLARDAESAKADIAKANATAAEATERNTQLEIRLEEERTNRIALQKALATPHLTPEQKDRLTEAVRDRVQAVNIVFTSDASSLALAQDIITAFNRVRGMQINSSPMGMVSPKQYGLFLTLPNEGLQWLADLFQEFGLALKVNIGLPAQPVTILSEKRSRRSDGGR